MTSSLADAYRSLGQTEEGWAALAEALSLVDETGEHSHEAELYRLKGELTLQANAQSPTESKVKEAEASFQKAIDIAQHR